MVGDLSSPLIGRETILSRVQCGCNGHTATVFLWRHGLNNSIKFPVEQLLGGDQEWINNRVIMRQPLYCQFLVIGIVGRAVLEGPRVIAETPRRPCHGVPPAPPSG